MNDAATRATRAATRNRGGTPMFVIGDAMRSIERAWAQLSRDLIPVARGLTKDPDLMDDLLQEARIALWELDPTRFELRDARERYYLWRALKNRMWKVWAKEMARGVGRGEAVEAAGTEWVAVAIADGSRGGAAGERDDAKDSPADGRLRVR